VNKIIVFFSNQNRTDIILNADNFSEFLTHRAEKMRESPKSDAIMTLACPVCEG